MSLRLCTIPVTEGNNAVALFQSGGSQFQGVRYVLVFPDHPPTLHEG